MVNMMVVGIGGGGCNAVDHMIETRIRGLKYLAVCTDVQTLKKSKASHKLQIGSKLTKGLSTGGISEIGRDAALEDTEKILEALEGMDMVVIVAGLGGGTGNGAAPIIASLAYELDALTVAVVTNPLPFERYRQRQAECSLEELRSVVDTLITIPNEWLLQDLSRNMTLSEAFTMANSVLSQAVQGISDLITMPGSIKLNFTDLRAFMKGMGVARLGIGHAMGESRVMDATRLAISSPLPETASINAARSVLINFRSGTDVTLFEVDQAVKMIYDATGPHAHIIFGTILDERMQNEMRVTVMAYVMQQ